MTHTLEDVCYTRSVDGMTLYAIVMGWPDGRTVTLDSVEITDDWGSVGLLGGDHDLCYAVRGTVS